MEPAPKKRKFSNEDDGNLPTIDSGPATVAAPEDKRQSLFIRSLPASVTKERLIEHFSQSFPLKHATVVLDPTTKVSRGFGFVTFTDAEDARAALAEFNSSVLDGRKIKCELAEARNREVEEHIDGKTSSKNAKGEELRAKRQAQQDDTQPPKLIVRNLPWSIKTAEDLSKLFLSYGKVKHAVVPSLPEGKGQAGFGILILRGRKNAERAMQGVNGKIVDGRTLAVDWAVDKETWQKVRDGEGKQSPAEGPEKEEGTNGVAPELVEDAPLDDEDVEILHEDKDSSDKVQSEASDEEIAEVEDSDEDAEADLSASDISDLAAPSTTAPSTYNTENTTVFIRNLPYDTDDETLSEHFSTHFGPVRYARVVYDHETERPRGTAFVCFRHEEDAKKCVKECPKQDVQADRGHSKVPSHSLLQNEHADPSGHYTLSGRLLHVTRALPKTEADTRASEGQKTRAAKHAADKRRLYLLSEGTVSPGSTLYNTLGKADLDIRSASAKQRQKMVKTNPNLGLSLTRLSIRNLPRWVGQTELKALARQAIVGFASEVKAGNRQPISKEELSRDGEQGKQAEADRRAAGKGVVKQAKIVYESDKTGTKVSEGKGGRSRGYGFIEYWGHRSALMGLRWLNGHLCKRKDGEKGGDDREDRSKRLIVEFAIENAQVIQRRDDRERRDKDRRVRERDGEERDEKSDRRGGDKRDSRKSGERTYRRNGDSRDDRKSGDRKRKRDGKDDGEAPLGKKQKGKIAEPEVKLDPKVQDEKNKVAARNRIIAQKRQKRRNRK